MSLLSVMMRYVNCQPLEITLYLQGLLTLYKINAAHKYLDSARLLTIYFLTKSSHSSYFFEISLRVVFFFCYSLTHAANESVPILHSLP